MSLDNVDWFARINENINRVSKQISGSSTNSEKHFQNIRNSLEDLAEQLVQLTVLQAGLLLPKQYGFNGAIYISGYVEDFRSIPKHASLKIIDTSRLHETEPNLEELALNKHGSGIFYCFHHNMKNLDHKFQPQFVFVIENNEINTILGPFYGINAMQLGSDGLLYIADTFPFWHTEFQKQQNSKSTFWIIGIDPKTGSYKKHIGPFKHPITSFIFGEDNTVYIAECDAMQGFGADKHYSRVLVYNTESNTTNNLAEFRGTINSLEIDKQAHTLYVGGEISRFRSRSYNHSHKESQDISTYTKIPIFKLRLDASGENLVDIDLLTKIYVSESYSLGHKLIIQNLSMGLDGLIYASASPGFKGLKINGLPMSHDYIPLVLGIDPSTGNIKRFVMFGYDEVKAMTINHTDGLLYIVYSNGLLLGLNPRTGDIKTIGPKVANNQRVIANNQRVSRYSLILKPYV